MKRKIAAFATVILCCAAVICLGIFASMAEEEPATEIKGHSLALQENIKIVYYVEEDNIPQGAVTGILFWVDEAPEEYTYAGAQYIVTEKQEPETISGVTYQKYYFEKLAAKQMTDNVYAVPFIKVGNDVTYGKLDKYSVIEYAYNKKGDSDLSDLLAATLNYGAEAQKYFEYHTERLATADYVRITVEGGTLEDGTAKGLYKIGSSVTLTATVPENCKFVSWKNSVGDILSTDSEYTFTVPAEEETYTAYFEKDSDSEGLAFTSNGDGTCKVTGIGTCTDTDLIIPSRSPAGDTVTSIGNSAFYGCTSLTSVTIPSSVTSIGDDAFQYCSSFTSVTFAEGSKCTSIYTSAFSGCTSLKRVMIPSSVMSIGWAAFSGCTSLTSVTFAEGSKCTSIDSYAFYDCTGLTAVYITDIAKWCGISFGYSNANPLSNAHNLYLNGESVTDLVIPEGVTSIGDYAFSGGNFTSVTIPSSVESIGDYAFYGCPSLTSVTIPSSVESIGDYAFYGCPSLTSVTIPDSVTSIGSGAFQECTSLTSVTIPDSITSIGGSAFSGCPIENATVPTTAISAISKDNLKTVVINGGTSVGNSAFQYCGNLTSVTILNSVESIGNFAFYGCTNLTSVTFAEDSKCTSIGENAFSDCGSLTSVTVPESVESIGDLAFYECTNLTSITFQGAVAQWNAVSKETDWNTNTGNYTVYCTDGEIAKDGTVTMYSSEGLAFTSNGDGTCKVTGIGTCTDTDLIIPGKSPAGDTVTSITASAFSGCTDLTSAKIPDSVASIGLGAFSGCSSLKNITIPFVGAEKDGTDYYWFGYIFGARDYNENGTATPDSLKSVIVTGGTFLSTDAFAGCKITSVTLPEGMTAIGDCAFEECQSLSTVNLPSTIQSIGYHAFMRCAITQIVLPAGLSEIKGNIFYDVHTITSLTVDSGNTTYYSDGNCVIETATGTLVLGCESSTIPIDGSVKGIGEEAFAGSYLTTVLLPNSISFIGQKAFYGCWYLTSATIGTPDWWWCLPDPTSPNATKPTGLSNPSTAAEYLRNTYSSYYWVRN